MAIQAYVGLPGSGKSYSAVAHSVLPALAAGRVVVTNILLDIAALASKLGALPQVLPLPDSAEGWGELPKGALIVIDEAWRWWPSGQRAAKMPEPEREFFAMHRHQVDQAGNSQQIVLVSQGLNQLNAFVKNLVETTFVSKKLQAVGAAGQYRVDVYDGTELRDDRRIRQIFGTYSADIWSLYQSHTAAEASPGGAVNEKSLDQRASLLKSWAVRVGIPLGVVAVLVAGYGTVQALRGMGGKETPAAAVPAPGAVLPDAGRPAGQGPPRAEPLWSQAWRVVAVLKPEQRGRHSAVYVEGLSGLLRQVDSGVCKEVLTETWCMVDGAWATPWTGPDSVRRIAVADKVKESGTAPGVKPATLEQRAERVQISAKGG